MTVFDLENEDQGVWFEMEGGGRVKLRMLTPADWMVIRKATRKNEPIVKNVKIEIDGKEEKKPQLFEREIIDEELQSQMINDMTILEWENFFDAKNNPIPCTPENRMRLMLMKDDRFRDFTKEKTEELRKLEEKRKTDSEKNL